MSRNEARREKAIIYFFWFTNILIWTMVYWNQCVRHNTGDYYIHNQLAEALFKEKFVLMYPGYHILVGGTAKLLGIETMKSSVVILVMAACASVYVTYMILKELLEVDDKEIQLLFMAFVLNIVQPIFSETIRPGYSSGNGYISPTQGVCKPFVLLTILIFNKLYVGKIKKLSGRVMLTTVLIISCLMKPLFAMAFVPAGGILLLIDTVKKWNDGQKQFLKLAEKYIKVVWPLILTGFFLIGQYFYGQQIPQLEGTKLCVGAETHIRFGFMHSWSMVVANVWISIIFAYFFPIIVFVLNLKYKYVERQDTKIKAFARICLIYLMVSFCYVACLYQDNGFEKDLNFRNAWIVSFNIVYCLAVAVLYKGIMKWKRSGSKGAKAGIYLGIGTLSVHIIYGLALLGKNILL